MQDPNESKNEDGNNAAQNDNPPRHVLEAKDLPWLNQPKGELTLPEITDPVMLALSAAGQAQTARKKRRKGWLNPY